MSDTPQPPTPPDPPRSGEPQPSALPPPPGADQARTDDHGAGGPPPDGAPSTPDQAPPRPGLDDRERALAPSVVTSWRIGLALTMVLPVVVGGVLGFVFLGVWGWAVLGGLLGITAVSALWYQPVRYRRWRWQLTELAVELRHGVLIHQQETVPYFRIQQIDIAQGPLDRVLDLATLEVTTASASGSASLPGIAADHAPEVRAELLARAADAVADHPGDLRDAV